MAEPVPTMTAPYAADPALAALRQRPIVLVGMMGSGKSSVGRRLAQRLALPFFDADDEIEHAAGMSISEIFERYGEPYFRDGERRVIARLLAGPRAVIATGGGAFAQDDTRAIIQNKGLSIWLDVDVPVLVARVAKRSHRPLLAGRDHATVLADLLAKRGPAYAQAHIQIQSDARPHSSTVEAIVTRLKELPR